MATGTLGGMAISMRIPTPQPIADRLPLLLRIDPRAPTTILDGAGCASGNLLAPFAGLPLARLVGIEISAEEAAAARVRLPGATIIRAAFEATRIPAESIGLAVTNPPYIRLDDGRRAEYAAQVLMTKALAPGGVNLAIIPARSGLDGMVINHWARHYDAIRCWRFPDGAPDSPAAFQCYTQIILAGVKRAAPRDEPDPALKAQLQSWRYDPEAQAWAGGTPPPTVPDTPIADPYPVPPIAGPPEILVLHAADDVLLRALEQGGLAQTPAWRQAVTYQTHGLIERPLMPPVGPAHIAALILAGTLDGDILRDDAGRAFVVVTATAKRATVMPIDAELQAQKPDLVAINQIEDHPVLQVCWLDTGLVEQFEGDAAFAFLTPMLPALAQQVLARHTPRYQLDPADWELAIVRQIGRDKQLPGAPFPGLAPAQMHRVFAMRRALWETGRCLLQGEPGVGKTRQIAALIAVLAHYWQERARAFAGTRQPAWARRLAKAWKANPHTQGRAPRALPIWIAPPKRVIPTWRSELAAAFPAAEVLVIRDHTDVDRWMRRCAESDAPVVVALISHSTKAATGLRWQPAVLPRARAQVVPDLDPPADALPDLEPIRCRGAITGYRSRSTGAIRTRVETTTGFHCPDCGAQIRAVPRGARPTGDDADELEEPVTSLAYFQKQRRRCAACDAPLWSVTRTEARERAYPAIPFRVWSQAAPALVGAAPPSAGQAGRPVSLQPDDRGPIVVSVADAAGARRESRYALGAPCPDSFSPYQYAYRKYRGCWALAIIDESHNGRGESTDIAHAHHCMLLGAQARLLASGTHFAGELKHIFHYLYRFNPAFWRRLGFGWAERSAATGEYGVIQEHVSEHISDARVGSGQVTTSVSEIEVPGASIRLLPHFLAEMVVIGVLDVGAAMPPLTEIPVLVPLDDPQLARRRQESRRQLADAEEALERIQATDDDPMATAMAEADLLAAREADRQCADWCERRDLGRSYRQIEDALDSLAEARLPGSNAARLAKGSLPRLWSILPFNPAHAVTQQIRGPWGDILREEPVYTAPVLAEDHRYPLERAIQELVASERALNRRVMLYYHQNQKRDTAARYAQLLAEHRPWCMPNLDPELREAAIFDAVNRDGHAVLLVPYKHVSEGLNLHPVIDTILWVEQAESHFLRDQASRRIWRLGKVFRPEVPASARDVRVYYVVYAGTAGHAKLHKLGHQNGAAMLFAGDTPEGALAAQAGADRTALARLSDGLTQAAVGEAGGPPLGLEDQADLDAAFARRNAERAATLQRGRDWVGVTDTLPERLRQLWAAELAPQPAADAAPTPAPIPAAGAPAAAPPIAEAGPPADAPSAPPAPEPAPAQPAGDPPAPAHRPALGDRSGAAPRRSRPPIAAPAHPQQLRLLGF